MSSKLFGIVFIDAITYNVMYKTLSGSHSIFPWVAIPQKEMFFVILWATNHNALSEIFIYLINVLTPYDKIIYVMQLDLLFVIN